ncbi:unnamed protein product, partial [Urochloa humidicola]
THYGGHRSRAGGPAATTATWRPKNAAKKVSFANPLVQIMGHPTREQRIRDMLANAPGWSHTTSPVGMAKQVTEAAGGLNNNINSKLTQHLPQPLMDT